MQEMEHEKDKEVAQEKLSFFTNISHELLTPLTIISCSVEELQHKLKITEVVGKRSKATFLD
ncbi:MAG: hypothetical protein LBF62_04740 [Tannerellaceae bacterium]|jgi:signal transduction histidine kinase|nr:hypothetical protein [Tannerellaceae bacterium]